MLLPPLLDITLSFLGDGEVHVIRTHVLHNIKPWAAATVSRQQAAAEEVAEQGWFEGLQAIIEFEEQELDKERIMVAAARGGHGELLLYLHLSTTTSPRVSGRACCACMEACARVGHLAAMSSLRILWTKELRSCPPSFILAAACERDQVAAMQLVYQWAQEEAKEHDDDLTSACDRGIDVNDRALLRAGKRGLGIDLDYALLRAAIHGSLLAMRQLGAWGTVDADVALRAAAGGNQVAAMLLAKDEWGASDCNGALEWAAAGGHVNIMKLLKTWSAATDEGMQGALLGAAQEGHLDAMQLAIFEWGATNIPDTFDTAAFHGQLAAMSMLIHLTIDPPLLLNFDDALHSAAEGGQVAAATFLLSLSREESGGHRTVTVAGFNDALREAVERKHVPFTRLLLSHGMGAGVGVGMEVEAPLKTEALQMIVDKELLRCVGVQSQVMMDAAHSHRHQKIIE